MREAQGRVVGCIEALAVAHPKATVAAFSHGDIIKAALAHLIGLHLDLFQRLQVAPAAVSAIFLGGGQPVLLALNEVGAMSRHFPKPRRRARDN
jgi:probable phosphoglycerate mutase